MKVKPSHLAMGFGKFCSRKCQYQNARKGKVVSCSICGTHTYRKPKDLKGAKSGKYFCSKSCQAQWRNSEYVGDKHANFTNGLWAYRSVLKRAGVEQKCRRCKTTDARVLAVHHLDRNRKNNAIENLIYLCHNCHHLIHHHKNEDRKLMATIV